MNLIARHLTHFLSTFIIAINPFYDSGIRIIHWKRLSYKIIGRFELHLYFCFPLKSLDELLERSDSGLEVEPIRLKLRGREAGQAREIPDGES